jgi:hypothetical protein
MVRPTGDKVTLANRLGVSGPSRPKYIPKVGGSDESGHNHSYNGGISGRYRVNDRRVHDPDNCQT